VSRDVRSEQRNPGASGVHGRGISGGETHPAGAAAGRSVQTDSAGAGVPAPTTHRAQGHQAL